jgi:glycine dehydrogenase subunit 1
MDFIANSTSQIEEMLAVIGVSSVQELFSAIPDSLKKHAPTIDDGLSEYEGQELMLGLSQENEAARLDSYLGAGAYEHHIPSLVSAVCQKSEFLTAYTPYQPEASQGMLQAIFEFQSAVCALTGMDVANASVYDGASACAEALLMALRTKKKATKVILGEGLHPHYKEVVKQYLKTLPVEIQELPLEEMVFSDEVAAVLIQSPNFFGEVHELKSLFSRAKEAGVITIHCGNPLAYGIYASPGEVGADIAVGDTQPFGVGLQYGGPYVGYIACRQKFVRQIPGRLVGETVDSEGKPGFVLTLQPREQHIRREKATSNICSNQALAALASLVAMVWYGKRGVVDLAMTNFQRASYLRHHLGEIPGIQVDSSKPIFNEFRARFETPLEEVVARFRREKIEPGLILKRFYPERGDELLICVTETKSKKQLDLYLELAREVAHAGAYTV